MYHFAMVGVIMRDECGVHALGLLHVELPFALREVHSLEY